MPYIVEQFSASEIAILNRHFTNIDRPVFALKNLDTVVAGAMMSRYSRSPKSLRRLFLDEFAEGLDASVGPQQTGSARADAFYEKNFVEYGDDSIAQLGGVHLACEQTSNVLTKVLEWGRLMAYIEQSTRYIAYDLPLGDRYRYFRSPVIIGSALGPRYINDMDTMFKQYSSTLDTLTAHVRATVVQQPGDPDGAYRQATRAKALDAVRGMLPAASLANLGMYGSGQAYENLLLRLRSHPLPEARAYGELILTELREVIPTFMRRVDRPDRGGAWSEYMASTRNDTAAVADRLLEGVVMDDTPEVALVDFDPDGEDKLLAAVLYASSALPEHQLMNIVQRMSANDRVALLTAYVGDRANRRHKPGRAFERTDYRFDVLGDYGAFRDLQRHRLMTIEWQPLTPRHGYVVPDLVAQAGCGGVFEAQMERSADLYEALHAVEPSQAAYAVSMAYRIRYVMQFNAREAMHLLELRTAPQGHPSYRRVCLEMHRLIGEQAGHRAVAAAMSHITHEAPELERLASERAIHARREAN